MIKTTNMLLEELQDYGNPKAKLSRMVQLGEYYRVAMGLYETRKDVPGYLLAGSIYGPSYISFEYALGYYGMIPETAYTITSATFEKKKKKKFETIFGTFTYRDVPAAAFPLEIKLVKEGEYFYRIAKPEKALCDKLYTMPPVKNVREIEHLIFEDLRVEEAEFLKLNIEKITFLSEKYHTTNIRKMEILLRRMQKSARKIKQL